MIFSIYFYIKIILVTHSKDVEENVNLVETVQHNKNVFNLDVLQLVVKEVSTSLLDNAPNLIIRCIIQKRSPF